MALSFSQTAALEQYLKPGMRVASLGYPDLIAPFAMFERMLDDKVHALGYRADSAAICKRHGLQDIAIPDAESFFKLMGCELDVYDIVQERGCEILCDLNNEWEHVTWMEYDIVLDVGTVEHCFAISNAIKNMAQLVKQGGIIIHENPFNNPNHGFFNLNPTFFADFYEANGFELLECKLVSRDGRETIVPRTQRFRFNGGEMNVFAMARRTRIQSFVMPTQSKYAGLIPAAGVPGVPEREVANANSIKYG